MRAWLLAPVVIAATALSFAACGSSGSDDTNQLSPENDAGAVDADASADGAIIATDAATDAAKDAPSDAQHDAADAMADAREMDADASDAHDGSDIEDASDASDAADADDASDASDAHAEDASVTDASDASDGADASDGDDGGDGACPAPPAFDYKCDPNDTSTCPSGFCVLGQCIAPQVPQTQWASCGDGVCDTCESGTLCPADCAPAPVFTGTKSYDDPDTIVIWVHGFTNHTQADLMKTTYGAAVGCNSLGDALATYRPDIPCGDTPATDTASNQAIGVEYYGAIPAAWMTPADIAEVEQYPSTGGATGLQRYSLVLAKFIKWRLAHTGAHYANIVCHSMGCLLTRYILENDTENLASDNKLVRWVSCAGVVAGAQLARLYDNPLVQSTAEQIGLATDDFALMNPDNVQAYAAAYDHKLWEGNSPYYGGMLIHQVGATDPQIAQAANIELLNIDNPKQNPNDGIMYTFDEMFAKQSATGSIVVPDGETLGASHAYVYMGHTDAPSDPGFAAEVVAGLYGKRKVIITLDSITLKKDHEFSAQTLLEVGAPPAEVVAETEVRYDPYTKPLFGVASPVNIDHLSAWSPLMFEQPQMTTQMPGQVLFEGPVFDDQMTLSLHLVLTETDNYVRYSITEFPTGGGVTDKTLLTYDATITLAGQTIAADDDGATIAIGVRVVDMY